MPIDFYYSPTSPPCIAVLLAAKAIGVDLNLKVMNLKEKKEHLTPEFLKINPQHSIPTIVDNGFSLWESRAIMTYLQDQYGKNDSLYPKDPKRRALIDQRLYYDIGTLSVKFFQYFFSRSAGNIDQAKLDAFNDAIKLLDTFLENSEFATGDSFTLADVALLTTISTIDALDHDLSSFKNVTRWYAKVKATAPGYEEIRKQNFVLFKEMIKKMRDSLK